MPEANVNDRASLERLYPPEAFAEDVGANAIPNAQVLRGLRIETRPDPSGRFRLARAARHVGEDNDLGEALFLAPFMTRTADTLVDSGVASGMAEKGGPLGKTVDYAGFLDRVIAAARSAPSGASPGPGEARLQGLRQ